jgi:hypothetical protein
MPAPAPPHACAGTAQHLSSPCTARLIAAAVGLAGRHATPVPPGSWLQSLTWVDRVVGRCLAVLGARPPGLLDAIKLTIATGWSAADFPLGARVDALWSLAVMGSQPSQSVLRGFAEEPPARPHVPALLHDLKVAPNQAASVCRVVLGAILDAPPRFLPLMCRMGRRWALGVGMWCGAFVPLAFAAPEGAPAPHGLVLRLASVGLWGRGRGYCGAGGGE